MIAFEDGELETTISAARRTFPGQNTTISADLKQTTRTFSSQCRDKQPFFCFAIRQIVSKSKDLFQYKSVKAAEKGASHF
jgi:hypothetical protein